MIFFIIIDIFLKKLVRLQIKKLKMKLVDTHTHLYLSDFKDDMQNVVNYSLNAGVSKHILPSIDSSHYYEMMNLSEEFPDNFFPLIGLHPCSVKENWQSEINFVIDKLKNNKFYGIGEVGIDLYWDKTFIEEQKKAFELQIQLALDNNLALVIHQRNSFDEVFEVLSRFQNQKFKGVFHCFAGDVETAKKCIDLGFLIGIGGVVTFKNSMMAEVVKNIDVEHIILETDSPYLAPMPYRGKRNQSSYLQIIAKKVSEIKDCSINEVAQITTENAERLFNL